MKKTSTWSPLPRTRGSGAGIPRTVAFVWVLLVFIAVAFPAAAHGQDKVLVEGIAAIVDREVILLSDLEEQLRLYAHELGASFSDTAAMRQLRSEILSRLIDERLLVIEAEKSGVTIEEQELEQAVTRALGEAKGRFGSHEEFLRELEKEGISEAQLKQRYTLEIKRQLLAMRLVGQTLRGKPIEERELRQYYDEHIQEIPERPDEVWVQHILVKMGPDSSVLKTVVERMIGIRERVLAGEEFSDMARLYSGDPSAKYGGSLGTIRRGDLRDRALENALFSLEPGEVSMPIRTSFGFHLLTVDEKTTNAVVARQISLPLTASAADTARARERARYIRSQIDAGNEFGELAEAYSEDELTRQRGGDLGYVSLDGLAPQVVEEVQQLSPGEVSDVFSTRAGFHILKLNGRRQAGRYTFQEVRGEIENILKQRKIDEWVQELRSKIYVDVRVN